MSISSTIMSVTLIIYSILNKNKTMKDSYYKNLFDIGIKSIKQLKSIYNPNKKGVWLSNRRFKKREIILQEWIKRMYILNKKYNPENK